MEFSPSIKRRGRENGNCSQVRKRGGARQSGGSSGGRDIARGLNEKGKENSCLSGRRLRHKRKTAAKAKKTRKQGHGDVGGGRLANNGQKREAGKGLWG